MNRPRTPQEAALARARPPTHTETRTLHVLAAALAVTVVGLPVAAFVEFYLWFRSPRRTDARFDATFPPPPIDFADEARRADELGLPGSARTWRMCADADADATPDTPTAHATTR